MEQAESRWETYAAVALVVAGAGTIFLNGLYDFSDWAPAALVLLALALAAVIAGRGPAGRPALLACGGLAALLAWSALSLTWADSVDRAWTEVNRLLLYLGLLVVGLAVMRTRGARLAAVHALGAAIGLIAVLTAVQVAVGDSGAFISNRLDAPVDYINGTAGLFLMGIWPLVAIAERARSPLLSGVAIGGAALEGNLLVLTQSRAIVPALVGSALLVVWLVPGRVTRVWALAAAGAAVAAALPWTLDVYAQRELSRPAAAESDLLTPAGIATLASAAVAMMFWAGARAAGARLTSPRARRLPQPAAIVLVGALAVAGLVALGNPVSAVSDQWDRFAANKIDQSTTVRFTDASGLRHDLWRVALEQFEGEPLHGIGAGSYGLTFFRLREIQESVRQPHSLELQVLAELGLVGGVALMVFLGGLAAGFARRRNDIAVAVGCGGVVIVWLIHTSVDWLWNLPGLTGLALLAAAALLTDERPAMTRFSRPFVVVAAIVAAVGAASLGRQYVADRYRADAAAALEADPAEALRSSRQALQLNPASMEAHYVRAAAFARYSEYGLARATLRRAVGREPTNFVPWGLLGDLAVRRGNLDAAAQAYRNASRLNPRDAELRPLISDPQAALR